MSSLPTPSVTHAEFAREAALRIAGGLHLVERWRNPLRKNAITFDHLGKLSPLRASHLSDLRLAFAPLLPIHRQGSKITVLGLAESGIVPSYAVASLLHQRRIPANWLCTTRARKPKWTKEPSTFREAHSHAPEHFIPPAIEELPPESELWIVEDELTTGETILNLLENLPNLSRLSDIRIFSMLDIREKKSMATFHEQCQHILSSKATVDISCRSILVSEQMQQPICVYGQPEYELAAAERITCNNSQQTRYAVGEEIAQHLQWLDAGDTRAVRQLTLSPWSIDNQSIRSRHAIGNYFLYNASGDEVACAQALRTA